jgi:hypothetical protein
MTMKEKSGVDFMAVVQITHPGNGRNPVLTLSIVICFESVIHISVFRCLPSSFPHTRSFPYPPPDICSTVDTEYLQASLTVTNAQVGGGKTV